MPVARLSPLLAFRDTAAPAPGPVNKLIALGQLDASNALYPPAVNQPSGGGLIAGGDPSARGVQTYSVIPGGGTGTAFGSRTPHAAFNLNGQSNVTIDGYHFANLGTGTAGVRLANCHNVTISNCDFENVAEGIYAADSSDITIIDCRYSNITGPAQPRTGANVANFIQFNGVTTAYIARNKGVGGDTEDIISIYQSSYCIVEDNHLEGTNWTSNSGSGIALSDSGGSNNIARRNILVNPGQVGAFIAGGSNCQIVDNIIVKDNGFSGLGDVGIYAADYSGGCPGPHVISGNRINWIHHDGFQNAYYNSGQCGTITGSNIEGDSSLHSADYHVVLDTGGTGGNTVASPYGLTQVNAARDAAGANGAVVFPTAGSPYNMPLVMNQQGQTWQAQSASVIFNGGVTVSAPDCTFEGGHLTGTGNLVALLRTGNGTNFTIRNVNLEGGSRGVLSQSRGGLSIEQCAFTGQSLEFILLDYSNAADGDFDGCSISDTTFVRSVGAGQSGIVGSSANGHVIRDFAISNCAIDNGTSAQGNKAISVIDSRTNGSGAGALIADSDIQGGIQLVSLRQGVNDWVHHNILRLETDAASAAYESWGTTHTGALVEYNRVIGADSAVGGHRFIEHNAGATGTIVRQNQLSDLYAIVHGGGAGGGYIVENDCTSNVTVNEWNEGGAFAIANTYTNIGAGEGPCAGVGAGPIVLSTLTITNALYAPTVAHAGGAGYYSEVTADSPVAFWWCDEASGDLIDEIGAVAAADEGGPTYGAGGVVTGHNAVTFDGTDDAFNAGDLAAADVGTGAITVECWFKTTSTVRNSLVSKKGDTGLSQGWALGLNESDQIRWEFANGAANDVHTESSTGFRDGNWHHLVAVRTGTTSRIYVDKVLQVGDHTITNYDVSSSTALRIGRTDESNWFFGGTLAAVAIYNTALSGTRIAAHYDAA